MELRQLFNPFLQLIQNKLNQINAKLLQTADDNEKEEEALNLKLLRCHKQLCVGIQLDLESYCDNLPVLGFNSSRCDLNLTKEYLLETLLMDFHCSPRVVKTCNKYVAMNFRGSQFLKILTFFGGATSLDNF